LIVDEIAGPPGEHTVEQLWHLGSEDARDCLALPEGAESIEGWRSTVFREKHAAPVIRVQRRGTLPIRLEARIQIQPRAK
jgi:hypothetical protein